MQHGLSQARHFRDVNEGLDGRQVHEIERAFGNLDCEVAHALEVVIDLDGRSEEPQVAGHGLLQGEQARRHVVYFDLHDIDAIFILKHPLAQLTVERRQRRHTRRDGGLNQPAHFEQFGLQFFEFLIKVSHVGSLLVRRAAPRRTFSGISARRSSPHQPRPYPNLPVM